MAALKILAEASRNPAMIGSEEGVMKVKHAIVLYLIAVTVGILASWLLAYFVAWWAGMGLLTIVLLDHIPFIVKRVYQN